MQRLRASWRSSSLAIRQSGLFRGSRTTSLTLPRLDRLTNHPFLFRTAHTALSKSDSIHNSLVPSMSGNLESFGNFDLVKTVNLDFTDVSISKWKSRVTGLTVVHIDYEAPIVSGNFVVATEIFDDSGCPHTLEHLVFMGSEKYPQKGVLDILANRGFSNGTNAWTDTDHTAYTISTAGEQGFLQLLPIYVDHILYPTITNAGFTTEVHHIDPKGQDAGVVYSEMQGRQNSSDDLIALRVQRLLDPPGSAYRSETGGLMEALRVLTPEQIREYHASYYVPHNLSLIVSGKFINGSSALMRVVNDQIEPSLIAHGQNNGPRPADWKRPFLETQSALRKPIPETIKETVEFPAKDESIGKLVLSYMGPKPNQFLERKALDILATYLTSSSVAPLNKEFIEIESPLCTYIYFAEEVRATLVNLPVYIGSVPTEHLNDFPDKLKKSLQRVVQEGIDMDRMRMVINREERQLRSNLESKKGELFAGTIISDFLYGAENGSELHASMDEINQYNTLRGWKSDDWTDLLKRYYIDGSAVIAYGKPSASLSDKIDKDEKARIAAQVKKLGPEGLEKATKELEKAKEENETPIPPEVVKSFPVPDVKSISWIPVQTVQDPGSGKKPRLTPNAKELSDHLVSDKTQLPFFVEYDHVKSDFVTVHAYITLKNLPDRLRPHVQTYLTALFSLPVRRQNGETLTYEEVVNRMDDETVHYEAELGVGGAFTELLRISIKVETAMYENAIAWLKDSWYGALMDKERLLVAVAKIQQSLPEMKRDGYIVSSSLCNDLIYDVNSTSRAGGLFIQTEFIPKLQKQLQESPSEAIADFEELRRLTTLSDTRFAVTGDVLKLKQPQSIWAKYFVPSSVPAELSSVPMASETFSRLGKELARKAIVMSLPSIESSYAVHYTKCISGFHHTDYPAIRVALEVLNAAESYLWRYIRGSGLAYGASTSLDVEAGLLSFSLYRSASSMTAFHEAAKVIKGIVDGSIEFDATTLEAAKSTLVYGVTRNVSTASRAATVSFVNQALKDVSQTHQVDLLEKYQDITREDVVAALQKYFLPLFDPATSISVIVTAPSKSAEIGDGLAAVGFEVTQRVMEIDPYEDVESGSDSESDSESDGR